MSTFYQSILDASKTYGINPELICAVIQQESRGDTWAVRFEPKFFLKYIKDKPYRELLGVKPDPGTASQETERFLRSTSFGLYQIMGETAREIGFPLNYLTELLRPSLNIAWGTKYLAKILKAEDNDLDRALQRWNGGGNSQYAEKVKEKLNSGEGLYMLQPG